MTTIATDGKSMAGDGQASTQGTIVTSKSIKVVRMSGCYDGGIYAACGSAGWGDRLLAWLNAGEEGDPPKGDEADGFMYLRPDGTLWQGGNDGLAVEIEVPFALGSGMDFAIGAMGAGKTAEEAVAIAAARDPNSGGLITVLHLTGAAIVRAA